MVDPPIQSDVWSAGSSYVLPEKPLLSDVMLCSQLPGAGHHKLEKQRLLWHLSLMLYSLLPHCLVRLLALFNTIRFGRKST